MRVWIVTTDVSTIADLNESETAKAIYAALPITSKTNRWGDEIYFSIPVKLPRAPDARDLLGPGELAYWPDGKAFCIFWGPTPSSRAGECRAYAPVNV